VEECLAAKNAGLNAVAIFPSLDPSLKNASGQSAFDPDGLIFRAVRAVKNAVPELAIVTDVALDPFTNHGHDGVLTADGATVANDETVELLCQ